MLRTKRIPDRVAKNLAKAVLEYVEVKAKHLLGARDAVMAVENAGQLRGLNASYISSFYVFPLARDYGFNGARALNDELRYLRNACYIIINMFSGIRNSEMMSLRRALHHLPLSFSYIE